MDRINTNAQATNAQAIHWAGLVARAAATALGVGFSLMMLVALTTGLAMATPDLPNSTGWTWASWVIALTLFLSVAVFGAAVLNHACRLIDPKTP